MPQNFSIMSTLQSIRRDLIHALRSLAKEKTFTLVCIISLGIGMGAVVGFSTFTRAMASPAPGINPAGLTEVLLLPEGPLREKAGVWALDEWSYPDYQAIREANTGLDIIGWAQGDSDYGDPVSDQKAPPARVATMYVTSNYVRTLGVTLSRGTGFDANDDSPSAEPRVIVNHDFWKSRLNSDPDIIGKSIKINGALHTVVGVTAENYHGHFHFLQSPGSLILIPFEQHPRLKEKPGLRDDRTAEWVHIYGKLQPGVDITQARARVSAVATGLAARFRSTNEYKAATVEPYFPIGAKGRPNFRTVLSVIFGLMGVVLLIVCVNISGMMMVRGTTRERELSIRSALGADRRTLIQHLFFEAIVIAFMAGGLSTLVLFGIPAIGAWYLGIPVPPVVAFDVTNAVIAAGMSLLVSVLFGLLPALRFSRTDLLPALKDDAGGGGTQTIRMHRVAAMVQIAVAVPFLVVSGTMMDRVRTADYGFPILGLAGAKIPATVVKEKDPAAIRTVRDNLRQASGVKSVAIADGMPIDFDYREFRMANPGKTKFATAHITRVGENFLETVGAKLLRGRTITAEDRTMDARIAVISEPLARQLFGDSEAIGQKVTATLEESRDEEFTVVGVTGDFASSQLTTTRLQILVPLPDSLAPTVHLIVRGDRGSEPQLKSALETALRSLGVEPLPGVAFPGIVTGQDLDEKSKGDLIAESTAVGIAGGLVLILAALGIVGVVGFMVATRTREFAVRMALGSTRRRVFALMLSDTVKLVVPGIAGGLLIGAVLIRTMGDVMGTPLYVGPEPLGAMEFVIYAGASAIAIVVALFAGLPAARRATSVQPMAAIRAE